MLGKDWFSYKLLVVSGVPEVVDDIFSLCHYTLSSLCASSCPTFPFYKDASPIELEPTLMNKF